MPADVKTLAPTDAILISRPDDHNMSTWSLHFLSSLTPSIRHCDHLNIFHEFPIVSRLKSKILITCPARCPIIGPLLPPEAHPAHPLSLLGTPSPPTLFGSFRGIVVIFVSGPLHMLVPLLRFQFCPLLAGQLPPIL